MDAAKDHQDVIKNFIPLRKAINLLLSSFFYSNSFCIVYEQRFVFLYYNDSEFREKFSVFIQIRTAQQINRNVPFFSDRY